MAAPANRMFISVAAYCDPLLGLTLQRALAQAKWPEHLHFGVIDQSPAAAALPNLPVARQLSPARLSCITIEPLQARGPCWARALAMSLYEGEDWFFQIDSHMDFDLHWDETLVCQAQQLLGQRTGPAAAGGGIVISSYPDAFVLEGGVPQHGPTEAGKVLRHLVKPGQQFSGDHLVLTFEACPVASATALPGFHLGAGCLFAPGALVGRFPYDPYLYFHGEEQALAARLFSHGWDIFHMPGLPIYHLYRTPEVAADPALARPLHWDASEDAQRAMRWWQLEQRARHRVSALLLSGTDPAWGVYGLGRVRSMADYAAFSGIDYAARRLAARAYPPQDHASVTHAGPGPSAPGAQPPKLDIS
ncbi:MAG: GlcNAc-transferase family protein [Burkholderiaceae bacterium]